MAFTLSIDLGHTSLGWSLIDFENQKVIDAGVRIFEAGIEDFGKGDTEKTLAADRRVKRQTRRRLYRRFLRLRATQNWLIDKKFWYSNDDERILFEKMNPYELRAKGAVEPLLPLEFGKVIYHLAHRRGFFANQREGAEDKETSDIKKQMGELTRTLSENNLTLGQYLQQLPITERKRARWIARQTYKDEFEVIWSQQKRNLNLTDEDRDDIYFGKVKPILENGKITGYGRRNGIFHQRPLKSVKHLVGSCQFTKRKRCPSSHPLAEEFIMWQQINNLKYRIGHSKLYELSENEKIELSHIGMQHELFAVTNLSKVVESLKNLNHKSKIKEQGGFDFYTTNYDLKEKLNGFGFGASVEKKIGAEFYQELMSERYSFQQDASGLDLLWHILYSINDNDKCREAIQKRWPKFSSSMVDGLMKLNLKSGYMSVSLKYIKALLPHLRKGMRYDEAAAAAGFHHSNKESDLKEKLGKIPDTNNPVVKAAMRQLKLIVNSIIEHYGKPDEIVIEMARELKNNKKQRESMTKSNNASAKKNTEAFKELEILFKANGIRHQPSSRDIKKYRLWQELKQGNDAICPYTGYVIGVTDLFGKYPRFDIEHIIPRSRRPINALWNLTLCERKFNTDVKGNKIPFEIYGSSNNVDYIAMLERVKSVFTGKENERKRELFEIQNLEKFDGFLDRELNDTKYASRLAKEYLQTIVDKNKIRTVQGALTSEVRGGWGFNLYLPGNDDTKEKEYPWIYHNPVFDPYIFEQAWLNKNGKPRLDHRHHAVDAVVIACVTRRLTQEYNRLTGLGANRDDIEIARKFPTPWDSTDFYKQCSIIFARILISYKKDNIEWVSGGLHKETIYGAVKNRTGEHMVRADKPDAKLYKIRKPFNDKNFKAVADVLNIFDPAIRQWILNELYMYGIDKENPKAAIPKEFFAKVELIHPGTHHKLRAIRVFDDSTSYFPLRTIAGHGRRQGDAVDFVDTSEIHHTAFFSRNKRKIDKMGNVTILEDVEWDADVITLNVAYERKKNGLEVVNKQSPNFLPSDGWKFMFAVVKKDMVLQLNDKTKEILGNWDMATKTKEFNCALFPYLYKFDAFQQSKQFLLSHHSSAVNKAPFILISQIDEKKEFKEGQLLFEITSNDDDKKVKKIKAKAVYKPYPNTLKAFKIEVDPLGFLLIDPKD